MVLIYVVVDVIWDGLTGALVWSVFKGTFVGFVCAVLDHAVLTPNGKRSHRQD